MSLKSGTTIAVPKSSMTNSGISVMRTENHLRVDGEISLLHKSE